MEGSDRRSLGNVKWRVLAAEGRLGGQRGGRGARSKEKEEEECDRKAGR